MHATPWPDCHEIPTVSTSVMGCAARGHAVVVNVTGREFGLRLRPADAELLANKLLVQATQARTVAATQGIEL